MQAIYPYSVLFLLFIVYVGLAQANDEEFVARIKAHDKYIPAIAFSPDGSYLASGSGDRKIKLWNVATGGLATVFEGHSDYITSLDFSPDGKTLASSSGDGTVRLWSIANGKRLKTFGLHSGTAYAVKFNSSGRLLASSDFSNEVKLWDVASGQLIQRLRGHRDHVKTFAFSPDGTQLVSGSHDDTVRIWDVSSGSSLRVMKGHKRGWAINAVAYSGDKKVIASGGGDATVKLWNAESGQLLDTIPLPKWTSVDAMAFSPDSEVLVVSSLTVYQSRKVSQLRLLGIIDRKVKKTLQVGNGGFTPISISPDGRIVSSAKENGEIQLWGVDLVGRAFKNLPETASLANYQTYLERFPQSTQTSTVVNKIYTLAAAENKVARYHWFLSKYPRSEKRFAAETAMLQLLYRENTLANYHWYLTHYSDSQHVDEVHSKLYKLIAAENNIAGYKWFLTHHGNSAEAKHALPAMHQLAYQQAVGLGTLEAYNDFIIAHPYADQKIMQSAREAAYNLEKSKYVPVLAIFGKEKEARKLLIQLKKLERVLDSTDDKYSAGYRLVVGRMQSLLLNEFDAEEATLRYQESAELKDFLRSFNATLKSIDNTLKRIEESTSGLGDIMRQQTNTIDYHFGKFAQSNEYKAKQEAEHRRWERYMQKYEPPV